MQTNLEIIDYLLSIKNVSAFRLCNIGFGDNFLAHSWNRRTPVLVVEYENAVSYKTTSGYGGYRYMSIYEVPQEYHEEIINFVYPYITPTEEQDFINPSNGLLPDNMRDYLGYRITQDELSIIRRQFQITDILADLEH